MQPNMTQWTMILAAALTLATGARAQEPPPLEAYGALPSLEYVEVSPAGERVAFTTVAGDQRAMLVLDLASGETVGGARVGDTKVRDLQWVGEERLLATTSITSALPQLGVPRSEFFMGQIYTIESRSVRRVFDRNRDVLPIMIGPPAVRETADGPAIFVHGYSPARPDALNLFRINPVDGLGRVAADADHDIENFVLDPRGRPLARADHDEQRRRWTLHLARGDGGRLTNSWYVDAPIDTPRLLGPGRSPETVVVSADRDDLAGRQADGDEDGAALSNLFEVDVATGAWQRLPFVRAPEFLIYHPRTRLLIGGGRTGDDGIDYQFLDPAAARIWEMIARAFPGASPRLTSWSEDLRKVVVFTSGSGDSGVYRLVDLDAGDAKIVGEAYPSILPGHVGDVRSLRYEAADGLEIHAYLTTPPGVADPSGLPLIVLAHGGPASRDVMGFDWWAQALASRGYAVLQANFRGSTGYGRDFMEAGYGEWGRKMQTDLSDGVRHLVAEGVVDADRVCIVGASYGGYAALAGATIDRGVYRCAVSVAGVSDLRRMVLWTADQGVRRDRQVVRYWNRFMGAERIGDRGLDALSPARLADQAEAPILLLHGRDDTVVPIEQSRAMASALRAAGKPHELIELPGEDHWLSRSATRQRMLAEMVRFLEAHNPPR